MRGGALAAALLIAVGLPTAPAAALAAAAAGAAGGSEAPSPWWRQPRPEPFDAASLPASLDLIRVDGNRFVDGRGEAVVLRGVSVADPDRLAAAGRWRRELFEEIAAWGADVVRLPVHPVAWRGRGRSAWCFDPDWGPQLISDWEYTPTRSGAFFRGVMTGRP